MQDLMVTKRDGRKEKIDLEKIHLEHDYEFERNELANIYIERGLDAMLAAQVAVQLMEHDALGAHARDELGIIANAAARPVQAALASAGAFTLGALIPLITVLITTGSQLVFSVAALSLLCLFLLGGLAARAGGGKVGIAAIRVAFWGALAMLLTALAGHLFGVVA